MDSAMSLVRSGYLQLKVYLILPKSEVLHLIQCLEFRMLLPAV